MEPLARRRVPAGSDVETAPIASGGCLRDAAGCSAPPRVAAVGPPPEQTARVVRAVPDFELAALTGGTVRLYDHVGKDVVLVDFWATYCAPCLVAMPHLEELYRRHADEGFVVLGISVDGPESVGQVRSVVSRLDVTFPILVDHDSRALSAYNPRGTAPYSVLIGRDGKVLARREGYSPGQVALLDRDVEAALR